MFKRITAPELSKIKVVDDVSDTYPNGFIEGYASVFGNVDLGGDMVMPGAFRKTLSRVPKGDIKYMDSHNVYEGTGAVVGLVKEAKEDDYGLWFRAAMSSVQRAQDIRIKTKEGILNAISFGYDVVKDKMDQGNRQLLELKLWEISSVIWGMNPEAKTTAVKSATAFQDWPIDDDLSKAWKGSDAESNFRQWVSSEDPADWQEVDWVKFRRGFLWFDSATPTELGAYKFNVVDVIDGQPKYVFRAAAAALSRLRGADVVAWEADKSKMENNLKAIYAKFNQPFPDEKSLIIDPVEEMLKEMKTAAASRELRNLMSDMQTYAVGRV